MIMQGGLRNNKDAGNLRGPGVDRCPVCGYRLRGLPLVHRCPECAFEYDQHTRVWEAMRFSRFGGASLAFCGVLLPLVVGMMIKEPAVSWRFWVCAAVAVTWAGLNAANIALYRARPFVAVCPAGVVMRVHWFHHVTVGWREVLGVRVGTRGKAAAWFVSRRRGRRRVFLGSILGDDAESRAFAEAVQAGRRRYLEGRRP